MSESLLLRQPVNKPGTSCLGCRRRKLKCTREVEGCHNCTKSDLPCVYPAPEVGVKRKRGPYKKDKPPRQRHYEDLVRYLEPKDASGEASGQQDPEGPDHVPSPGTANHAQNAPNRLQATRPSNQTANSEDLVKDALIALTRSSVQDQESRLDDGAFLSQNQVPLQQNASGSQHPPIRRVLEYWHLFVTRVDLMTKVIHRPTVEKKLYTLDENFENMSPSTHAMLFSIYYAAVTTCTPRECRRRFGEAQDVLLKRFGRNVESALGENYDVPAMEALQALVLYIICIRRKDDGTNVRSLFTLAVRSAQMIGLHEDPEGKYSPFEVEMRRRLWYHLYGLESRTAEETGTRSSSIMQDRHVKIPSNLNDYDLDPKMKQPAKPRQGVTDMTFSLLRFEVHSLVYGIWRIRKHGQPSYLSYSAASASSDIRGDQVDLYNEMKAKLDRHYLSYLDASRPYDDMCLTFAEGMLAKTRLLLDFPFGTVPDKAMPEDERMHLLRTSVDVIQLTHLLATDERFSDWVWYYRGFVQWHSLAVVVAELTCSSNTKFSDAAWQVLDPILVDWDTMYKTKRDDPAWDHVNSLIERARLLRRQRLAIRTRRRQPASEQQFSPCAQPLNADYIMPVAEGANGRPPYTGSVSTEASIQHVFTPQSNSGPTPDNSALDFDVNFDWDALENIDFSAFDEVFGGGNYDFLDPLGDIDMQVDDPSNCPSLVTPFNR